MDDALGNALAIEVTDLLEELVVLERGRSAVADRALVLVVADGVTLAVGQRAAVVSHGLSVGSWPRIRLVAARIRSVLAVIEPCSSAGRSPRVGVGERSPTGLGNGESSYQVGPPDYGSSAA